MWLNGQFKTTRGAPSTTSSSTTNIIAEPQKAASETDCSLPSFKLKSDLTSEKQKTPTIHPDEEQFIFSCSTLEERRKTETEVKRKATQGQAAPDRHLLYHARDCSIPDLASWDMSGSSIMAAPKLGHEWCQRHYHGHLCNITCMYLYESHALHSVKACMFASF